MKKYFFLFVCAIFSMNIMAQHDYTIFPVPQKQIVLPHTVSFSKVVTVVAEPTIDQATRNRAEQILKESGLDVRFADKVNKQTSNLLLGTNGSHGSADKKVDALQLSRSVFSARKYDRHIFHLYGNKAGKAQLLIVGENTDAVFCGLATLEQIFDGGTSNLSAVTIYDYADLKNRGVIEGYYGVPYSAEVTKDLFRFMARYKMNAYMYGAKSDPYHSKYWGDAYPTTITPEQQRIGYLTQQMLKEICDVAHENKVNFIWAIHPGHTFMDTTDVKVIDKIMDKFEAMHQLGVRQFGVFVDDVGVPDDDVSLNRCALRLADLQNRIDQRWNGIGAMADEMVKPLHYVPQLYAYSWVSLEKGERFFRSLRSVPEKVNIYITGRKIWSVPNSFDLERVAKWLGNEPSWWWNYPCNDNDVTKLFPMDIYANFRDEKHIANMARLEPSLRGTGTIILNPMQQGEVSKIALFSAADYTWHNNAFNAQKSWEASLKATVSAPYVEALRKAAPFLRYYDADALEYIMNDYKQYRPDQTVKDVLLAELKSVHEACGVLEGLKDSKLKSDRLFYDDLRPWLLKLKAMTRDAVNLLEGRQPVESDYENNADYKFEILTGLGDDIKLSLETAEPAAQTLRPFIDWLKEDAAKKAE